MNFSKYDSKKDPKHNADHATVEAPSANPVAKPAVAVVAFKPATQVQVEAVLHSDLPAPKANGQDAPTVVNDEADHEGSSEAMVSEGAPAHAGQAVREPGERVEEGAGDKSAPLSAMPIC